MAVTITGVQKDSPAAPKRISAGDILLSVNAHSIRDVLDYRFFTQEARLRLCTKGTDGKICLHSIRKAPLQDLGLLFATYLMDQQRRCKNKCIFCFIDQLPENLRGSLYFKDDDARLSFLFGNYITLTNLTQEEAQRIVQMHISPVNVSVHTMNPRLRCEMMGNKNAGDALGYLRQFADAGLRLNTQLVLCPGINDGAELRWSLEHLLELQPGLQSIAVVPVGLTRFREGLHSLKPFTKESAKAVIAEINRCNRATLCYNKKKVAFAADEFYLKADLPVPPAAHYGDFPQLENGVGMWALLREEFLYALDALCDNVCERRTVSIATGISAYPLLKELAEHACQKVQGLNVWVYAVENHFFGEEITVAGLLTGGDLAKQLTQKALGQELLLCSTMLRREGDLFLDGMTPKELENKLKTPLRFVPNDGQALLNAMLGKTEYPNP